MRLASFGSVLALCFARWETDAPKESLVLQ
jgi:hypothetical protein